MNKITMWFYNKVFGKALKEPFQNTNDASSSSATSAAVAGILKRLGLRNGDSGSTDFEEAEYDLSVITTAYDTDSYIRQGVDKYVDQIFKEGYDFYGKDQNAVDYLKLRFSYIAEATSTPTGQLLIEMAEDVVKYSNCIIAKSRAKDQASLPPGATVTGINGEQPVAGYFCINTTTVKVKRDKYGTVKGWQQEVGSGGGTAKFKPQDIVHIYYKREKGNAFGTPFLHSVLDDVRALRQAEENILKMMYRNIYPFYHVAVGDDETPGTPTEVQELQDQINSMDVEGGLVTTNRVQIKPIASDKVINAEPYLKYLEERVFSGMGIPSILFGRGNTANRSTGDNMTSEMADRIKAIQKTIEMFINSFIVKELLLEGGYDPILNPDQNVEFKFRENDLDLKIKNETHAVFLYEHNAITEDEMRHDMGRDLITDRAKMHQMLITKFAEDLRAANSNSGSTSGSSTSAGSKQTNNKQKPQNQHGTKTSPKKTTNSTETYKSYIFDLINETTDEIILCVKNKDFKSIDFKLEYICYAAESLLKELQINVNDRYIDGVRKNTEIAKQTLKNSEIDCMNENSAITIINSAIDILRYSVFEL